MTAERHRARGADQGIGCGYYCGFHASFGVMGAVFVEVKRAPAGCNIWKLVRQQRDRRSHGLADGSNTPRED